MGLKIILNSIFQYFFASHQQGYKCNSTSVWTKISSHGFTLKTHRVNFEHYTRLRTIVSVYMVTERYIITAFSDTLLNLWLWVTFLVRVRWIYQVVWTTNEISWWIVKIVDLRAGLGLGTAVRLSKSCHADLPPCFWSAAFRSGGIRTFERPKLDWKWLCLGICCPLFRLTSTVPSICFFSHA